VKIIVVTVKVLALQLVLLYLKKVKRGSKRYGKEWQKQQYGIMDLVMAWYGWIMNLYA
jgi:hypothetical protein